MSTAEESTSPAPLPAAPNVYLRITKSYKDHKYNCYWYKLDLERQKSVSINWLQTHEYLYGSAAVAVKSEIYLLGGVRFFPAYCSSSSHDPLYYEDIEFDLYYEDIESDDVYRIDTAANDVDSFESAPSMLKTRTVFQLDCAVLGDKIIIFNNRWWTKEFPHTVEIFEQSSDQWVGFSKPKVAGLHRELRRYSLSDRPLTSDSERNRVLIHFEGKGLYAFYPDSSKWERLSRKRLKFFELSVVVDNVFYYVYRYDDEVRGHGLYGLGALDATNGFKPLKIVWPCGFESQFSRDLRWLALLDLGNGKLCLVAEFHKCLNDVSDEYYYSSGDEDEDEDDELCSKSEKKKNYMLGVTCFVLESEKQPPPPQPDNGRLRPKARLLVKTASRFDFEFDELVSSSVHDLQVQNAIAV